MEHMALLAGLFIPLILWLHRHIAIEVQHARMLYMRLT
jgi:hypothetical protein